MRLVCQGTKKPIWDFENILLETDGSNNTEVVYTLEPNVYGNLISQRRNTTTRFFLFDALGSTRKLTSTAGSVTDSYDFWAYGEQFASSGSTTNVFRWVGRLGYYYDIDRLSYYLRARTYSPKLARFLSQDPIGYDGSLWNLYEYVNGRSVLDVDPSGFYPGGNIPCQARKCQCSFGVRKCLTIDDLANRAIEIANRYKNIGEREAIRHCVWMCEITRKYGRNTAHHIGCIHEDCNKRNTLKDRRRDLWNNEVGKWAGRQGRSPTCHSLCRKALGNGRLQIGPGDPFNPPGSGFRDYDPCAL